MKKSKKLCKLNNSGAGVVAVIVAIALVSILVSVVLSTSYANFKMKQTNYKTKSNFYSAEKALDEINLGLQGYISEALSFAYLEVISEYGSDENRTAERKNELMEHEYYQQLWSRLEVPDTSHKKYNINVLYDFVSNKWDDSTQTGALVTSINNDMITYEDKGIVLKDIEVYYRDDSGFSTMITTDIRLACPIMQFGNTTALPNVMDYAIVADKGLKIEALANATNTVDGQIYAKTIDVSAPNGQTITMNFLNTQGTKDAVFNVISKEDMNFTNAKVSFPESGILWAKGINLVSSEGTFRGTTNISNDLSLNGKNSKATIEGTFTAYGNSTNIAEESSSIVINGTGSVLDLTGSEIIAIAGHAFVGTREASKSKKDTDTIDVNVPLDNDTTYPQDKRADVLMGESIAVKSDQLLYLLPGEAIGISTENKNKISLYGKNPLTKEEYKNLVNNSCMDVDPDYVFFKVSEGGTTVEKKFSYFANDVIKVFIPSGKTTMVYYYIAFKNDQLANEFFKYYYNLNTDKLEKYLSFYTETIKMPDTTNLLRFQTAGNMVLLDREEMNVDGNTVYKYTSMLQENTVKGGSVSFTSSSDLYAKQKLALCTKLITNYMDFFGSELEESKTTDVVFKNLVDVTEFDKFVKDKKGGKYIFQIPSEADASVLVTKAILTTDSYTYKGNNDDKEVNLIICSKDVTVEADYEGLILCGGKLTVNPGVTITKNDTKTKKAFRLQNTEGAAVISPLTFMVDGDNVVNVADSSEDGNSLILSDLIVYENWTKE